VARSASLRSRGQLHPAVVEVDVNDDSGPRLYGVQLLEFRIVTRCEHSRDGAAGRAAVVDRKT
jgi:hypothetical protein